MEPFAKSFITRVRAGLSAARDLSGLADWIVENTRHPKDNSKPWSYLDHEYQIDILSNPANDLVGKKPAQVGFSEISVRMALGLIDIYPHVKAIYTLPTSSEAVLFTRSRFDDVISNSPYLRGKLDNDVDNASLKRLGDSYLYIRGTWTMKAAISIPAEILIHDEIDFSDQATLTSFTSRLGHVKEEDIIKRRFSTPTVAGYGVSELFEDSTQAWRGVKCDHCGKWQIPTFLEDVVLPGYDGDLLKLEKEDIGDPRYDVSGAYLACPGCKEPLSISNLADPSKREWIAKFPGRSRAGYQIQSFDVPTINPIPRTLRSIKDYKRKADWVNFAIGQDYQDAETSFILEAVKNGHCLDWVEPRPGAATGTVIGIDVGKTCWLLVGRPRPGMNMDVLHYERLKIQSEEDLPNRAVELFSWYGAQALVIDAGPEWTQALAVLNKLPAAKAFACYYADPTKPTMSFITSVDEEERVIRADRTAVISDVARRVNGGRIRFCRCPDQETMIAHLDVIKKIVRRNSKGVDKEAWVNVGDRPDHYGHALFFSNIALNMLGYNPKPEVVPALPLPAKVRVGWAKEAPRSSSYRD